MTANRLMLQGTGSNVGKSILVAGLCRAAKNRGFKVAPFKPQNMSNNAAVCPGGGEIGRAQALQARAAGIAPEVRLNPVLLKPESDRQSQVIVLGEVVGLSEAQTFFGKERLKLLPTVLESFEALCAQYDLVIVEGAGSPAETNLRDGDIANMGFAAAADVPVCMVADIDRGGSIASLVGTYQVLSESDRSLIQGFMINKFRGDVRLFDSGLTDISGRTSWRSYGVIPWLPEVALLPEEDAVTIHDREVRPKKDTVQVAVPMLSRIANFDDFDPLKFEPGVDLKFIPPGKPIPLDSDVVVIPGTKSTIADLAFLRNQGWDIDIQALARQGRSILGICGGYQMLGNSLSDPSGKDGLPGQATGLGLLDIETTMEQRKTLRHSTGNHVASGAACSGYEIHVGATRGVDAARPFATTNHGPDGATNPSGTVAGTYLHGIFNNDQFRTAWLRSLKPKVGRAESNFDQAVEDALDQLALSLEDNLDIDRLLQDCGDFR